MSSAGVPNGNKVDRRVLRTRQALQAALLELIEERGYGNVTVEAIAERANIGRTTFYLHYRDKEDLLLERFRELLDDLVRQVDRIPLSAWQTFLQSDQENTPPVRPILMVFQHAQKNQELYRLVMGNEGAFQVGERLRDMLASAAEELRRLKVVEGLRLDQEVPFEVFTNYYSGALMGVLTWWLEQEQPESAEEMARLFQRLFIPTARRMLGF